MTMLEDPDRRRNDTKANDMEVDSSQENQRKAVVTGFLDDTRAQEVQDKLKDHNDHRNVIGTDSDQVSHKADRTCILPIQRQRRKRQF